MGLNVPVTSEHVFWFENENFAHTSTNIRDLESFMDNDDNLNNVFLVQKEDDDIEERYHVSQIEKEDMYEICRVDREGYKPNTKIQNLRSEPEKNDEGVEQSGTRMADSGTAFQGNQARFVFFRDCKGLIVPCPNAS